MNSVRRYERGKLVGYVPPVEIPPSPWSVLAPAPAPTPKREPKAKAKQNLPPAPTMAPKDVTQGRTTRGQFDKCGSKFGFDKLEVGDRALIPDIPGVPKKVLQRRICWSAIYFKRRYGIVICTGVVQGGVEIERIE